MDGNSSPELQVDGVLKEAYIAFGMAYGRIYGDRKGRFPDGTEIHTSRIIEGPDANGVVKTRNSVYRLELVKG